MSIVDSGWFGPSQTFLNLTDKFIEAIIDRCTQRGLQVDVRKYPHGEVHFIVGDEIYSHKNNGVDASVEFVGFVNRQ